MRRGKYDFILAIKFVLSKYKEEIEEKNIFNRKDISRLLGYNEKYINDLEHKGRITEGRF